MYHFNHKNHSGFTLIELLIVLVLIGLSSSFILPSMWQQLEQTEHRAEISKIHSLINYSKQYAFYKNIDLSIEVKGNRFIVKTEAEDNILREVIFETMSFEQSTLYFDAKSNFIKNSIVINRNNGKSTVEIDI